MKNRVKKSLSLLLAVIMMICAVPMSKTSLTAKAVTMSQLNDSSVFLKQAGSTTCTLCAATMMLRRYSMLRGDSNWNTITESSVRSPGWINGQGLRWSFTYSNSYVSSISVGHGTLPGGSSNASTLIEMLKKCPEGIVIYNTSVPHAVLLTDYTDGVFYCADPLGSYPSGRIPLTSAYKVRINNVTAYWKVTSPVVPGPTTHTHNYTGDKLYQPEHPHQFSQRCVDYDSCGGFIWLDEYYNDPNCSQCNRCTGYRIGATSDEIFDSTAVEITITPFVNDREANDSEIESITLSLKKPNGDVLTGNFGTERTRTFYFGTGDNANPYGKYVLWAKVNTKYGSSEGSESKGAIAITLKKSNLSTGYSFSDSVVYRRIKFSDLSTYLTVESDNNIASYQRITSDQSQVWKITKNSDGSSTITSMKNGKVLDVDDARYISGRNVLSYTSQNSDNQKWLFRKDKDDLNGRFFISPLKSDSAVLDVYNGNTSNGTNVQIWTYNQGSAQKIEFELPYTISYNANGGSGAPSSQKKDYGKTLTLSSTKPTRSGYTFLGWSTSKTATSPTYSAGGNYSANADSTLYAVWKANTYTLTYDGNGFSSYSSKVENVGTTTIKKDMPNRFGYNFKGWSKSKTGSAKYMPGASITLTSNTTLYAVWGQDSMSLEKKFIANILGYGGVNYYKFVPSKSGKYVVYSEGDKDPKVTLYSSSGTELAKNDDGGDNKNFRLVYDLQAGTTYYYAFNFYSSSAVGFIQVRFGPVYTISYNANGGSGAPSSQSKDWNKDITLSSAVPTRSGYTFLGWSTSSSATSATYNSGATYSANSNATLYAVWKSNACSHTFNSGKITTAATCKATGVKTYTCTACGATKTETIAKNPSNHTGGTAVKNAKVATCTAKGYTGDTYCLGCGVVTAKGKDIAIKAHTFNSGKVTIVATCKATGVKTYTCTACGATKTETIAKNPSNHTGGTAVKNAKSATCTAKGYTGDTYCLGCGVVTAKGKDIAVKAHTFNSGKVTTAATCKATGVKTYTCTACGATKTETIAKLGHTDKNNDGKCDTCGESLGTTPGTPEQPETPSGKCNHLCHKGGFIWRIVRFFWKLFRMNKYCSCGAAHY